MTGTGWISLPVGLRAYIDAHRGPARTRLDSFRHRGLPLQYGHDRPGWAELAVLEAEGAIGEAATLAGAGRHTAEAFAREELACAAAPGRRTTPTSAGPALP